MPSSSKLWSTVGPVASTVPSLSKSHRNESTEPSGSVEFDVKVIAVPVSTSVALIPNAAVGRRLRTAKSRNPVRTMPPLSITRRRTR